MSQFLGKYGLQGISYSFRTSSFTDQRGKQLRFSVKGGSADTFLWKGTVRVQCEKVLYKVLS